MREKKAKEKRGDEEWERKEKELWKEEVKCPEHPKNTVVGTQLDSGPGRESC